MQDFGANRDFFSKFWTFVTFAHNHIQCLMTTQDFKILKGKGVQEHKIQGIFGGYWGKFCPQWIKILVSTEQ